jgi:hypothetical protein
MAITALLDDDFAAYLIDANSVRSPSPPPARPATTRRRPRVLTEKRREQNRLSQQKFRNLHLNRGTVWLTANPSAGERRKRGFARPPVDTANLSAHAAKHLYQHQNDQTMNVNASAFSYAEFGQTNLPVSNSQLLGLNDGIPENSNVDSTSADDLFTHIPGLAVHGREHADSLQDLGDAASLDEVGGYPFPDFCRTSYSDQFNPSPSVYPNGNLGPGLLSQQASECHSLLSSIQRASVPVDHLEASSKRYPLNARRPSPGHLVGGPPAFCGEKYTLVYTDMPLPETVPARRPPAITLPNPYRNHIRVDRYSLFAACHENARILGVIKSVASPVAFKSPFYQPDLSEEVARLATENRFNYIKPDLRPCVAQLLHRHDFYIDVFPFPKFRERAVSLLSLSPPAYDEMELRNDLDRDGLICWGGALGTGSSTPWDTRSWEAQPWFLSKWWMLTKGSGLDEQSRWWRSIRGEEVGQEDVG